MKETPAPTTAEVKKPSETPSTKKIDTTKSSKINDFPKIKNELSGDDDDNYYDYSEYYDDDDKVTRVADNKSTSDAPDTKPVDKDVKLRPIERTKVS